MMKTSFSTRSQTSLRALGAAALVALAWTQNACVHSSDRVLAPDCGAAKIDRMRSLHVQRHALDDHQLAEDIAAQLRRMGKTATVGGVNSSAGRADGVITYTDKWMWDITMYLLSLDIQLREPGSGAVLATAKTTRTSLVRKSQAEMVGETLDTMFGKGVAR